jgi:hypothetical protein
MRAVAFFAFIAALVVVHARPVHAARPFNPCCYVGEVTESSLDRLALKLSDGSTRALGEALPGLLDSEGGGGQPLHPQRWRYLRQPGPLAKTAPAYDANDDGMMDHQELVVLVIVEAARGLGVEATALVADGKPVRALAIPSPEIERLTGWLKQNESRLSDAALSLFMDVDSLRTRTRRGAGSRSG